jgi:inhibitor of the pro-sigma K processing machinery
MFSFDSDLFRVALLILCGIGFLFAISFLPSGFWKVAGKVVLNCVVGFLVIFAINFFGADAGLALPFNWLTLAVSGILGIPGVAALAVMAILI